MVQSVLDLPASKYAITIVLKASKSVSAKGDVPKIYGFVYPLDLKSFWLKQKSIQERKKENDAFSYIGFKMCSLVHYCCIALHCTDFGWSFYSMAERKHNRVHTLLGYSVVKTIK